MKKKFIVLILVVVVLLTACGPTGGGPESKVSFGPLPQAYAEYAGGYVAQVHNVNWETVSREYYYWKIEETEGPVYDNCVDVGRYTQSIVLQNQPGYGWEQKGEYFCLYKK